MVRCARTVGLLLAALFVSIVASMPNWWQSVNPNDLSSVETYFKNRYAWRAWFARVSILLFVVAVIVAGFTVWSVLDERPRPLTSLQFATGEKPAFAVSVSASSLAPGAIVRTELRGCAAEECTENDELLVVDRTRADSSGKAEVKATVAPIPDGVTSASLTVMVDGKVVAEDTVSTQ